jgi:hypothetical protein
MNKKNNIYAASFITKSRYFFAKAKFARFYFSN